MVVGWVVQTQSESGATSAVDLLYAFGRRKCLPSCALVLSPATLGEDVDDVRFDLHIAQAQAQETWNWGLSTWHTHTHTLTRTHRTQGLVFRRLPGLMSLLHTANTWQQCKTCRVNYPRHISSCVCCPFLPEDSASFYGALPGDTTNLNAIAQYSGASCICNFRRFLMSIKCKILFWNITRNYKLYKNILIANKVLWDLGVHMDMNILFWMLWFT